MLSSDEQELGRKRMGLLPETRSVVFKRAAVTPHSRRSQCSCRVCDSDRTFLRQTRRPNYEISERSIKIVDLFCGCGGLSLGIAEAARSVERGVEFVAALDHDEDATQAYRKNFPGARVHCASIEGIFDGGLYSALTTSERRFLKSVGYIDMLVGGPPCQGHSDLNNRTRRSDPRNALYARMARAAAVLGPSTVLIENVPAVCHDVHRTVNLTMDALLDLGYAVHHCVLDLSVLGAPQRRRRHVVLAVQHRGCSPQQILETLTARCERHLTRSVGWAIADLIDLPGGILDTPSTPTAENARRIAYLFKHNLYDLPNRLRPKCHQSKHSYRSMYGRLRWDQPAQTITTGFGSMGQGRFVHPRRARTITPHEAARLQMIPDFLDLSEVQSRGALATLIGNTVPPVLTAGIGRALFRAIYRGTKSTRRE
jgi:DNA (cytosine-5)-methyltransferase 1